MIYILCVFISLSFYWEHNKLKKKLCYVHKNAVFVEVHEKATEEIYAISEVPSFAKLAMVVGSFG